MAAARREEPESAGIVVPAASGEAVPIVELEPEPLIPEPMEDDDQIREAIDQHVVESEKRKAHEAFEPDEETNAASGADRSVVTWQPEGSPDQLRWKRTRVEDEQPGYLVNR